MLFNSGPPAFPGAINLEASNRRSPRKGAGTARKHTTSRTVRLGTVYHFLVDSD